MYEWGKFTKDDVPQESEILVSPAGITTGRFFGDLFELFCGEVGRICDGPKAGYERCFDIPDDGPVYGVEERMVRDLFNGQPPVGRRDQPNAMNGSVSLLQRLRVRGPSRPEKGCGPN